MLQFVKSLFAVDSVVNTATKIVDKIAGTDFTAKEKAQFILDFQEKTKHQSPARRVIALSITFVWLLLILTQAMAYVINWISPNPEVLMLAKDMKMMMQDLIKEPFNYVIMFYFGAHIIAGIKK